MQPKFSKSPKPYFAYDNFINTPKQPSDIRMSHQQALQILSQYENVNNRNPQSQIVNFKSHDITNHTSLKDKKKSISSATSNSTNGTFNTANVTHCSKKTNNNGQNKEHKKSQSLYNKKIVDIIQGLQQSLGVIASNVQNSFNNGDVNKQNQEKALLESAILAQKLAQMTSSMGKQIEQNVEPINKKVHKRMPSNSKAQVAQPSKNQQVPSQKFGNSHLKGFKTIEDSLEQQKDINSNRQSLDFNQKRGASSKMGHQRTKSDIQNCRKILTTNALPSTKQASTNINTKHNTILAQSQNSIDNNPPLYTQQQAKPSQLISSASQLGKFLEEQQNMINQNHQAPLSAKNRQVAQNRSTKDEAQKVQSIQIVSGSGQHTINQKASTLENSRRSVHLLQKQILNGERLSEANFIMGQNKNNLIMQGCQGQENKLRSAASSPTLHQSNNTSSCGIPLKLKQSKPLQTNLIFDFGHMQSQNVNTAHTIQQNIQKIAPKKKSLVSNNKQQQKQNQSSSHKRATSDGSSLTKMFHFKQQMLINKIFSHNNKKSKHSNQNTIQYPPTSGNLSKLQPTSLISSKPLSDDDDNQENLVNSMNYSSPRLMIQKQPCNSIPSQSQVFADMKNFLDKFKEKTNGQDHQQKLASAQQNDQKLMLIQAIKQQNSLTNHLHQGKDCITNALSNGSNSAIQNSNKKPKPKQQQVAKQVKSGNSNSIENIAYQNPSKRQSQQLQKGYRSAGNQSMHKRAKSDIHQVNHNTNKQQKQVVGGQKMFFLNLNHQIEKPIQSSQHKIYSARASPQNSKINYYNLADDTSKKVISNCQTYLPTARSDKQASNKIPNVFSNQTTQKKIVQPLQSIDTPQFNYLVDSMPKARLQYNDEYQTIEERALSSSHINKNFLNNILYGGSHESTKIYHNDEFPTNLLVESAKMNSVNQSPKLKILPTPKAIQPGLIAQFDNISQQFPTTKSNIFMKNNLQINAQNSSFKQIASSNFMIAPTNRDINKLETFQTQQSKQQDQQFQYLETFESTAEDNLSPRSKEKKRLIKLIKVSFNKLKEPIKTTAEFYRIGKMLGKGAFGRVNLGIHKLCEQLVAVKSINKQFLTEDESSKKKVMQEVLILQKTRNCNIVKLFDSFETNKHIVFVMELCSGGDLLNYVRKRRKLKEPVAKYIFKQVVEGLFYCHSKGIVHRDIKLDNLLLNEHGVVKICDFGVSRLLQDKNELMTEQCGTPAYIAPEILKDKGYKGFGVDVWSLGVCLYAMLYGTVPFKANNMSELHQLIMKAKYSLKDDKVDLSDDAKSLIKLLLEPDPIKRIRIDQVRLHPWIQEANESEFTIEIFTEEEKQTIKKDFTYQDMARFRRNQDIPAEQQQIEEGQVQTTEHFFTEHALDSTTNVLLKNCSTKSVVLAPFNSTRSHIEGSDKNEDEEPILPPLEIDENMIFEKKVIKYAARVKDVNRQYEMNNNCELDNGVYNKFVKQSTDNLSKGDDNNGKNLLSQDNSLVTSMNNENHHNNPQAPLVSQTSDDEAEAELLLKNQQQNCSELQQLHTFLQMQGNKFTTSAGVQEEELLIDYEVVEKVEGFGYPRQFIIESIEKYEMNDAGTCYNLLDKERQQIDMF